MSAFGTSWLTWDGGVCLGFCYLSLSVRAWSCLLVFVIFPALFVVVLCRSEKHSLLLLHSHSLLRPRPATISQVVSSCFISFFKLQTRGQTKIKIKSRMDPTGHDNTFERNAHFDNEPSDLHSYSVARLFFHERSSSEYLRRRGAGDRERESVE